MTTRSFTIVLGLLLIALATKEVSAFLRGHRPTSFTRLVLLLTSGSGLNNGSTSPNESNKVDLTVIKAMSTSDPIAFGVAVELLPSREPYVSIEVAPSNSRRIFTGVDIMADMESIWEVLTAFDRLQDVVPSLVKNEVLYRTPEGGARLAQVGGAKVLPGVTFTAKTVLDVRVFKEDSPMPASMLTNRADIMPSLIRGVFPTPDSVITLPHRDIAIQNVLGEGDFEHYQGVWRMQSLPHFTPYGGLVSRLTYAVEIKPKGFLPVKLIEGRIATDLKANLAAIRDYVENLAKTVREEVEVNGKKEEEVGVSQTPSFMKFSTEAVSMNTVETTHISSPIQENDSQTEQSLASSISVAESSLDLEASRSISHGHSSEGNSSYRGSDTYAYAYTNAAESSTEIDARLYRAQLMRENEGIRMVVLAMESDLGIALNRIKEIGSLTRTLLDQEADTKSGAGAASA